MVIQNNVFKMVLGRDIFLFTPNVNIYFEYIESFVFYVFGYDIWYLK
jgi:hypothetical protein